MSDDNELVIVFAGNTVEADFLRSILEAEGIEAFMKDEHIGTIAPFLSIGSNLGAVKIFVRMKDLETAERIVREFIEED